MLRLRLAMLALVALSGPVGVRAQDAGGADAGAAAAPVLVPPQVIETVDPVYPPEELASGASPTVSLHVTLDEAGAVREAHVDHTAGARFDAAAIEAVRRWRFAPATRGGVPIAARVRVAVAFALPDFGPTVEPADAPDEHDAPTGEAPPAEEEPSSEPPAAPPEAAPPGAAPEAAPPEEPSLRAPVEEADEHPELGVEAELRRDQAEHPRSASELTIDRGVLEAAPHREAGDLLATVPGMFAARTEGDAVGHRLMLRGFDAEHGQDIELSVEGVPINLPSHIHGQGYADVSLVLPEVVEALHVTEGPYDPSQGDFAVAGSVDFRLGVRESHRGVVSRTTYGSFDTFRQLLMWAPRGEAEGTFGAAAFRRTDGYGQGRASDTGTGILSWSWRDGPWRGRLFAIGHGARASLAGVVRADDIASGRVGFHDRYADPNAEAQSALAIRALVGARLEHRGERGRRTRATLWGGYDDFRTQQSFTGYTERSRVMPEWVGRGDLIEQQNQTASFGLRAEHRTEELRLADWLHGFLELGLAGRVDVIEQRQNLLAAPQNETWDQRVDASITGADLGAWVDVDWHITDFVRLRGGVRGDALFYDVDDRLGNFIPAFRRETYILGFRRSAFGFAAGPRASVEVRPIEELSLVVAYGEGYRSPQARQLQDGEAAPFTKVRSGDLGFRLAIDRRLLVIGGSAFYTHLSDDIVFEPREGRLEPVGPSTRLGGVAYLQTRPTRWLTGALSLTYVHATLDEPPPASAENPTPAFEPGAALPYVAPFVLRADVGAHEALFELDGHPVRGRVGVGFSFLSPRPLPFGQAADPVALLDAQIGASWRWFTIGVAAFNLFDSRWAANELFFVSNWRPSEPQSRIPARHVAAGAPLTVLGTLGITL